MRKVRLTIRFLRSKERSRQIKPNLKRSSEKSRSRFVRIPARNSLSKEPSRKTTTLNQIAIVRRKFKFSSFPIRLSLKFSRGKEPSTKTRTNDLKNKSREKLNKFITVTKHSQFTSGYSLADWFGFNARQDKESIYISKKDLVAFGLVPREDNSLDEIVFCLNQIWISNEQPGCFNVVPYRYITLSEGGKTFAKESYLIKLLSTYNREKLPSS
jgi:hypothetical protein